MASSEFFPWPNNLPSFRREWPTKVGQIPGLTPELESLFRDGIFVIKLGWNSYYWGDKNSVNVITKRRATVKELRVFEAWEKQERIFGIALAESRSADKRLSALASTLGIKIDCEVEKLTPLIVGVLEILPKSYFDSVKPYFWELVFYKDLHCGDGRELCGSFDKREGLLEMFDLVTTGFRRHFVGMFLHELGHPLFFAAVRDHDFELEVIHNEFKVAKSFLDNDFQPFPFGHPAQRVFRQQISIEEFFAETFMIYVAQGSRLRRFIAELPSEGNLRGCWLRVYEIFKELLGGREYA